jgi:DHA2 family multidrug resistance protein-like MFS transporter
MAFLPEHPTYFDVAWRMFLSGIGYGLFLAPNSRTVIGASPRARAAAAGGLLATVRLCGQTIGATLVATLLALNLGTSRAPALVAAGLAALACLSSLARLRPVRENDLISPADAHVDVL